MARKPAPKLAVEPIKRQAIVVVHGQGQQRPMGTIRDFVTALWASNPDVTPDPPYTKDNTWIVPDNKSGLYEMQRITTPPHGGGRRTDFFELYYADLLADTPIRNLWRWLERLFWTSPSQVPKRMHGPWSAFRVLSIVAMLMTVWVVLDIPQLLKANWLEPFKSPMALEVFIGLVIVVISVLVLVLPKLFIATEGVESIPRPAVLLAMVVGVGLISWHATPVIVAALLVGLALYLFTNDLLPLFGDAASYLSAQTETVRSRQAVRSRGLSMLEALHNDREYDRIVVVAHSLGTVLAYDLLQLLWHSVGPTKDNAPDADAVAAIEAVEAFANKPIAKWTPADVDAYQALQWQAFSALRRQKPADPPEQGKPAGPSGWKVSDFVTLGSPLANAEFLVTEGPEDLKRLKSERVLPVSPPEPRDKAGFIYKENGRMVTHHAAVFSTVRWTNIYDEFNQRWFLHGDVISGAVASLFGPGIKDIDVPILKDGKRTFTHNLYWVDTRGEAKGKGASGEASHEVRAEAAAPQIQHLRDAVGMQRN